MFKRKHKQCAKAITAKYKMQRFMIWFEWVKHLDVEEGDWSEFGYDKRLHKEEEYD